MNNCSLKDISSIIDRFEKIAIVTHVGPDGDAAGSSLAFGLMLKNKGKDVTIYLKKDDLGTPSVMDGLEYFTNPDDFLAIPDLLITLDCAAASRISIPFFREKLNTLNVLNIDHHGSNDGFGTWNYIVADASSTGEIIWDVASVNDWSIDRVTAEALWVAIVTDTGRFSYSSVKPSTLDCASSLIKLGVRNEYLNDALFSVAELRVVRLKAKAYSTLETWFDGRVAIAYLDAGDYIRTGCKKSDSEEFVNIPRSVKGTLLAIFFYRSKMEDNSTRLSIRARAPLNATKLATHFGGGGHIFAAGATLDCGVEEAIRRVYDYLKDSGDFS